MRNKYTKENLQDVANKCTSFRQMLKEFGLKETGGNYSGMQKRCEKLDVDTSHFTGQGWNKLGHPNFGNNIDLSKRFIKHEKRINAAKTKDILLNHKLKEYKCEICGLSVWNDKPITLQLHHINGDGTDDRIDNLQLLCPNCHSQTDSYCKRLKIRNSTNLSAQEETLEVEAG